MALSHTPLPKLCFARNHTNFLLFSPPPSLVPTYCLSAIKFLVQFACCCISFVHLHDKWNYTCTPVPHVENQMPRARKPSNSYSNLFYLHKMLCTLCRWAIFYFLRSCSVFRLLDAMFCFFFSSLPFCRRRQPQKKKKNNIYILRCNLCTYLIHYAWAVAVSVSVFFLDFRRRCRHRAEYFWFLNADVERKT